MRQSDIKNIDPMGSVFRKSEHETIAQNIALILSKYGNEFRLLGWGEYVQVRADDGADQLSILGEKSYFEDVVRYLETEHTARLFSRCWDMPRVREPLWEREKFARLFDLPKGQLLYWIDYDTDEDQYVVHLHTYKNGVHMHIKGYLTEIEPAMQKMQGITEESATKALDSLLGLIENPTSISSKSIFQSL